MIKWDEKFSCGIEVFDKQHQKLFEMIQQLHEEILKHKDNLYDNYDTINSIIAELKGYTLEHFKEEEEKMRQYGYSELLHHRVEHKKFIDKVQQLTKKDIDVDQIGITIEIVDFIASWIGNHILKTDMKYSEFLRQQGVQ
ncbi:hemerythrin [Natronincola peptidivorans]|uniref:Hemerythrin n=1 Tax=Natronincola peptidivorans TaxID=426128 RepID=A0A1I0GM75_9FIRM|nr:bacteriohemerythrin [Natronincola peptidivorans]SET71468.1 hemerythrin [Natronincola peptidivorans]